MYQNRGISSLISQENFQVIETEDFYEGSSATHLQFYENILPQNILSTIARRVCKEEQVDYDRIPTRDRFLLVRFRCSQCGMQPLYLLDLQHSNKARCLTCLQIVSVKNRGKYGRIRKKIAIESFRKIRRSRENYNPRWHDDDG